jgi:MraZ protein
MFLGQFYHNLDEKGRVTIPANFRELLLDGGFVTQGFDKNLNLLTESAFTEMAGKVNSLSETDPNIRKLRRLFFANAGKVDLDRLGRILIPSYLREIAKLNKEVVIVGVGDAIEIWSPEYWQQQVDFLSDSDANAQQFKEFNI